MKPPSVKGKRKKKKDEEIACTEPAEERKEKKKGQKLRLSLTVGPSM